jgi:archaellum component FlaF (FlaF/FlaG flagellin family)
MASSLIAGAVSLLLIIVAGYVIATGILMVAETTVYTQIDVSYNQEFIKQTDISMDYSWDSGNLSINVSNNGSTSFTSKDFEKMDLYIYPDGGEMQRYSVNTFNPKIPNIVDDFAYCENFNHCDVLNKGMWDPAEVLIFSVPSVDPKPDRVIFVMPNGVTATA